MKNWDDAAKRQLISAARTIEENAEKMIGGYERQIEDIEITIRLSNQGLPVITVRHELLPDKII